MFITPASFAGFGRRLAHDAAEGLARNWTTLLLNGIVLVIAGVLIFSIDWSVRSLSTFLGALFILEGVWRSSQSARHSPTTARTARL